MYFWIYPFCTSLVPVCSANHVFDFLQSLNFIFSAENKIVTIFFDCRISFHNHHSVFIWYICIVVVCDYRNQSLNMNNRFIQNPQLLTCVYHSQCMWKLGSPDMNDIRHIICKNFSEAVFYRIAVFLPGKRKRIVSVSITYAVLHSPGINNWAAYSNIHSFPAL